MFGFLSVQQAETLASDILLFCAFIFSATLTGMCQSLVALWLGDNTGIKQGWLTPNPFKHVDFLSVLLFAFIRFAWINLFPLNPHNITGKFKELRLFFLFSSGWLLSLFWGFWALLCARIFFQENSIVYSFFMLIRNDVPLHDLARSYPLMSSTHLVIGLFFLAVVFYNLFIAALLFFADNFRYALVKLRQNFGITFEYNIFWVWLLSILIIILFAVPLRVFFLRLLLSLMAFLGVH